MKATVIRSFAVRPDDDVDIDQLAAEIVGFLRPRLTRRLPGMTDDRDDNWFDSEPYGDQLCECPCGHQAELMPEETGWCTNCLEGRHEPVVVQPR